MKIAVFAGTFDPVTSGHEEVIKTASALFDKLIVAICVNPDKKPLFPLETRLKALKAACENFKNTEVLYHDGLLVDLMRKKGAVYNVRGVRNDTDYVYENEMHFINERLYPEIVTIFFPCGEKFLKISSTAVRKRIESGESLKGYLSENVLKIIEKKT